jgi:hypothetical protein
MCQQICNDWREYRWKPAKHGVGTSNNRQTSSFLRDAEGCLVTEPLSGSWRHDAIRSILSD